MRLALRIYILALILTIPMYGSTISLQTQKPSLEYTHPIYDEVLQPILKQSNQSVPISTNAAFPNAQQLLQELRLYPTSVLGAHIPWHPPAVLPGT